MELHWRPSQAVSCLHAAEALCRGEHFVDDHLRQSISQAAAALDRQLSRSTFPARQIWQQLTVLAASLEDDQLLAATALEKVAGNGAVDKTEAAALAEHLAALKAAVRLERPNLADQLQLRVRPLREQWEARGPGLLRRLTAKTHPHLLPKRAEVIVVHPALGGAGRAHAGYHSVCIEGLLVNVHPQLPEVVRLGWLLSQLQPELTESSRRGSPWRLPALRQLAMLPPLLEAAEEVELAQCSEATLALALRSWRIEAAENSTTTEVLQAWWEGYCRARPDWTIALERLDQMLGSLDGVVR